MSNSTNVQFIGLPKSGKTTYLAALWHVIEDQSSETKLRLNRLSGDRTYLNLIVEAWRACTPVPRTTMQADDRTVLLHLDGSAIGAFTLSIPDLSGEAFDHQLEHRKMSAHHADGLRLASGVILFVHPDVQKGITISQQDRIAASIGGTTDAAEGAEGNGAIPVAWKVEMLPTQAKLVDLLQFVLELVDRRIRVAVVVSAWDLVEALGPTPHEYVSGRMPLLRQFLDANDDLLEYAVFGVSAQGGAFPDEKFKLLELDSLNRIKVRHGDHRDHDITKPLAWLLGDK